MRTAVAPSTLRAFTEARRAVRSDDLIMTMTATARSTNGQLRQEVNVNRRHVIITDEPEQLGGTDEGPAPHELLPAMLASCISTMIMLYARTRHWQLRSVQVDVGYDPDSTPREVEIRIHLPGGLTPDQVTRLERVAQTCPARRALEAGFSFTERMIVGGSESSSRAA